MTRALELADELAVLRHALEGVRLLVEISSEHVAPDEETARLAPRCAVAVTTLVVQRLHEVERATRGTIDPAGLIASHNEAVGDEGGVRLVPWDTTKVRAEAEREHRRLGVERRTTSRSRR